MRYRWCSLVVLLALCHAGPGLLSDQAKQPSNPFMFVREFSTAEDVRRAHPVVEKTLEIVAGPKEQTSANDVLKNPIAIGTDAQKRVFVLDRGLRAVHVFDFGRAKYSVLQAADRMQSPVAMAVDQQGSVYIADSASRSVLVFDSKGKFSKELMRAHGRESYFEEPRGIAIHKASGRLYVCDPPRNMVIVLDKRGKVVARIGKRGGGRGQGEFRNPVQVAVSGDEALVLDAGNSRFQVFDMQGRFRREAPLDDVDGQSGFAADSTGNVYLGDDNIGQVKVFSPQGRFMYRVGTMGTAPGQFNGPHGLWIDSGCLYVADSLNRRVQVFRSSANACR